MKIPTGADAIWRRWAAAAFLAALAAALLFALYLTLRLTSDRGATAAIRTPLLLSAEEGLRRSFATT